MHPEQQSLASQAALSRRSALLRAIQGTCTAALFVPAGAHCAPTDLPLTRAPEFVPENDYPFFDGDLPPNV